MRSRFTAAINAATNILLIMIAVCSFAAAEMTSENIRPAQILISRGVNIKVVNEVFKAAEEFDDDQVEVFVPPGTLMITHDPTSKKEIDKHFVLVLTENGFWGFLNLDHQLNNEKYFTEAWIRRFNEAKETPSWWARWRGASTKEICSPDERYSNIVVVTHNASALDLSGDERPNVELKPGSAFKFVRSDKQYVYVSGFDREKPECASSKIPLDSELLIPNTHVKVLNFPTDLTPGTFTKRDYIRAKRAEFISNGFVRIFGQELVNLCGQTTTFTFSTQTKVELKQQFQAGFNSLVSNGSYSIDLRAVKVVSQETQREFQRSEELIEAIFVSGDGETVASVSKIANCQQNEYGDYKSLGSNADWFYRLQHPKLGNHTFDCEYAKYLGLQFDHNNGKLELNNYQDYTKFVNQIKVDRLQQSISLLLREVTEWQRPDSRDHCK